MSPPQRVTQIAIIGAGPVGIACAKYLLAEKVFQKIDIFEQRDRVGGIWNITATERTRRIPIPQLDPQYGSYHISDGTAATNVTAGVVNGAFDDSLEFESPLYNYLEANVPKQIMQFSDTPFPDNFPLFPNHEEVLMYLEDYSKDVKHLVHFDKQVQGVRRRSNSLRHRSSWEVTTRDVNTTTTETGFYDAVVVANGHYTVPIVPEVDGLARWNETYPGLILHSKAYRLPEHFANQRVLIIGNNVSGMDIAAQIQRYSAAIFVSGKSVSTFGQAKVEWREDIDEVVEFLDPASYDRAVRTRSGKVIERLNTVIFATGYYYSFPFLSDLDPPIVTDGLRTRDTYKHFIHMLHPTLAFPVLNMKIIPFGLVENQAAVIARLWSGRLDLPSLEDMRSWEQREFELRGAGKHFHMQTFPDDARQMNELRRWAESARKNTALEENDGKGKLGMFWNERQVWIRSKFPAIRSAYAAHGEQRRSIKTVEEMGFDYNTWRQSARPEDLVMFEVAQCPSHYDQQ